MYANVCKAAHNGDTAIAEFITAGFTGQIRGWWDNVLTPKKRDEILNAFKIIHTPTSTKNEQGHDVVIQHTSSQEDDVYTLATSIIQAFVGTHPKYLD